jgi:predicted nuclease with TOPRIM domain
MKSVIITILAGLAILLGFSGFSLRKELLSVKESVAFSEKRSEDLQKELMRVSRAYNEKERFLEEIEQNIAELESKVQLETLQRYIPKKTWSEIKPIIDRLKVFQEERESSKLPRKHQGNL